MRIHSLTTRFLLTLLLSTALPFLAFGWYARTEMERRLEGQVVRVFLPDQARKAAEEIQGHLKSIQQAVGTLQVEMSKSLRGGVPSEAIGARFERDVDFMPHFHPDLVLLVDDQGMVRGSRLHPRLDPKTLAARRALLPADVVDAAWYQDLRERRSGEVWDTRHLSPYLHKTPGKQTRDPKDHSFALAYSVPTRTAARWAVYALFSWNEVQQVLDDTARFLADDAGFGSAQAFLCDARGYYLAHTDRARYAGRAKLPLELAIQLPAPGGAVELPMLGELDEPRRAGFAAVDTPSSRLEWWVGLHARESELLATSRELGTVLLVATSVVVLILVAWSMVASRAILRPVRRLAEATERVARGDLSARVPARGRHELADLGRAFNRMAEDLVAQSEQLRTVERQAAWAEMARQIAHEIQNPLTPMRMSAQLLLRAKAAGDPRVAELTDRLARTVVEQTDALTRIASDFRQFAGPPRRVLTVVDADQLLEDVERHFAAVAEQTGVVVAFAPHAQGAQVEVDREELRRVLLNLLHNAHQACGDGGEIAVSSEADDTSVLIRVADNGPGVAGEVEPRLFDPYFTTKSSGTGLGLAISRRILEAHGGGITLEATQPGRTVFRVELPRV